MASREERHQPVPSARHLSYTAWEARTILSFRVRENVLQARLAGWRVLAVAEGHDQGANFRIGLTDQLVVQRADGLADDAVEAPPRFATNVVSAIHEATGTAGRIGIGGISTQLTPVRYHLADDTVAAVAQPAAGGHATVGRATNVDRSGVVGIAESWELTSGEGRRIAMALTATRGRLERSLEAFRIYPNAPGSDVYRQYHIEKLEDVVYSRSRGIDRRLSWSFAATGPGLDELFDGSEQLVSIACQPYGRREVFLA